MKVNKKIIRNILLIAFIVIALSNLFLFEMNKWVQAAAFLLFGISFFIKDKRVKE